MNRQIHCLIVSLLSLLLSTQTITAREVGPARAADTAARVLDVAGAHGGLIVHIGCGDGTLTASLRTGRRYLVQGLDTDASLVEKARRRFYERGLSGCITADTFDGAHLPYADNLVNLLVVTDPYDVSQDEMLRVLAPGGTICTKTGQGWKRQTKDWPEQIDQWSHFLHDASGNAVAHDKRVGPPRGFQWIAGPLWSRSHEFNSSLCAMVSAGGRLFYVFDEGLTGVTTPSLPERWTLTARDAFNGVLLWKRSMDKWGSDRWSKRALRSIPETIPRRLVAAENRVFMTLGYNAPVSVLDAATGEVLTTYAQTEGTQELRLIENVLLLQKNNSTVMAIDTQSDRTLWQHDVNVRPCSLTAKDDRVFYQEGRRLHCRSLRDGEPVWNITCDKPASLIVAHDALLLLMIGRDIHAVSTENGQRKWAVNAGINRREMFVANDRLWHWQGEQVVGRHLNTGDIATRLQTDDVFTPGHHLRCYQSKATDNFLVTPFRGVEFVSICGGDDTQNDWVRGPCGYGIMPCNGLLYAPPHPCFCYPGVKLTGFNALAPAATADLPEKDIPLAGRLIRGAAYAQGPELASKAADRPDIWPTYRRDVRRTGSTSCTVPSVVAERWRTSLQGELTPPTVGEEHLYVAAKNACTVYALNVTDGSQSWVFTAGGPVDSPPSLCGRLVIFGSADGHVYCLRALDGALVWRFRAAPLDKRIVAFGRLESPWRVHGSVLVCNAVVYCTAGRSSYLDGGVWLYGIDVATGKVLHQARVDTWARTRKDAEGKPFVPAYHMEGIQSDVLVSQDDFIYLGQTKFDLQLNPQRIPYVMPDSDQRVKAMDLSGRPFIVADAEPGQDYETHQRDWLERTQKHLLEQLHRDHGSHNLGDRDIGLHVFSTAGFLDDSWFNRTFWMYSATWPGYYIAHRAAKTGQLLVVGPGRTYAVGAYPSRNLQSPLFTPGQTGYLLFADDNGNEPVLDSQTRGTTKGWGFTRMQPPAWHNWMDIRIRAMVLAHDRLFVLGPPDVVDPADPMAAFENRKGAILRMLNADTGSVLAERELAFAPVFDGLVAAHKRLFISLQDGSVMCLGPKD